MNNENRFDLTTTNLNPKINLLVMLGVEFVAAPTAIETTLDKLLQLTACSILRSAQTTAYFNNLIILTNQANFEPPSKVILRYDDEADQIFHFGQALRRIAASLPPEETLLYVGAGAGLLLEQTEWDGLRTAMQSGPKVVTANNYFSADLVGWQPMQALLDLAETDLPESDNNLAWVLCRRAGLSWQPMLPNNQRTLAMQFDIDTPTDAAILNLWFKQKGQSKPHLSPIAEFLAETTTLDNVPVGEVLAALADFESEVLVMGRVSAGVHRILELRSFGQTRILSEERGMRAGGREARGEAISLAGFLLEELGPRRFFEKLAKSADAAIIDSRVLFAHLKLKPSRADRFNSDIFQPDLISNPEIRAFTEAALEARERWNFPILLGGHSAVSGSLLLLLELLPLKSF